jgi:hypothetical protein
LEQLHLQAQEQVRRKDKRHKSKNFTGLSFIMRDGFYAMARSSDNKKIGRDSSDSDSGKR